MPTTNFHTCIVRDSGDFQPDSFRTIERDHKGRKYNVIVGKLKGDDAMTEQSYRYAMDTWDKGAAQSHCKGHDGKFEPGKAEEKESACLPCRSAKLKAKPEWLKATFTAPPSAVDRNKNIIQGVVLAEEGPFKDARGEFDADGIGQVVRMAASKPAGLKSRFTHPSLSSDGLGKFLGRVKDVRLDKGLRTLDDGSRKTLQLARGNLYLDPSCFETPHGNLGKYILDLAENDPDAFAMSLAIVPDMQLRRDARGIALKDKDGEDLPPLWFPKSLHACDVVDTGDATNGFLSPGITIDGLPDAVVRQASALIDQQFPDTSREVIEARCQAWLQRYLDWRYPAVPPTAKVEAGSLDAARATLKRMQAALVMRKM